MDRAGLMSSRPIGHEFDQDRSGQRVQINQAIFIGRLKENPNMAEVLPLRCLAESTADLKMRLEHLNERVDKGCRFVCHCYASRRLNDDDSKHNS